MKKKHWTQTPEGRKRLREKMLRQWADGSIKPTMAAATPSRSARALAREEVNTLAREGAKARLADLEREMIKLRVFLGLEVS